VLQEGSSLFSVVDINFYLSINEDVAQAYGNREQALDHYAPLVLTKGVRFPRLLVLHLPQPLEA
jgi:hypothetical protein